jgi:hypothetical protein
VEGIFIFLKHLVTYRTGFETGPGHVGFVVGQSGAGAGFLRVLRFPLQSSFAPPITPESPSCIIRGMHNRPMCGRSAGRAGSYRDIGAWTKDLRNLNLVDLTKGPNGSVTPTPPKKKYFPQHTARVLRHNNFHFDNYERETRVITRLSAIFSFPFSNSYTSIFDDSLSTNHVAFSDTKESGLQGVKSNCTDIFVAKFLCTDTLKNYGII